MENPKRFIRQLSTQLTAQQLRLSDLAQEAGEQCMDMWEAGGADSDQAPALDAALTAVVKVQNHVDTPGIMNALNLCLRALDTE